MDAISKGYYLLQTHTSAVCSISGGSDSDVMLDIVHSLDVNDIVKYVFFDTGLEYQATKKHLNYLEDKYHIQIQKIKPDIPIPLATKRYGQPFISKYVSEMMQRLQRHNFQWVDDSFEVLIEKYPNCVSALKWWCNKHPKMKNGDDSTFNINRNKGLKEFIVANPPEFKISNKCCFYCKKQLGHKFYTENRADLNIIGVRKAEGGIRAQAYTTCFSSTISGDEWRPLFWFSNTDKLLYMQNCDIVNSDCYTKYGLTRTGCVGCPYGKNFEFELETLRIYEPELYVAVLNVFGDSYNYTRAYNIFRQTQKQGEYQLSLF